MQTNFTTSILFTAAQQSEYILCTYSVAYPITPPPPSAYGWNSRESKSCQVSSTSRTSISHHPTKKKRQSRQRSKDDVLYLQNAELPTDPDSIAAPYDIRLLEHRQIGNMALKSRPLLSYGVRSCPATGISRKPRYTPRRPVRAALYRL